MVEIATFGILPSEEINESVYVIPEFEPFNLNFQQTKMETIPILLNIGSLFYVFLVYGLLVIVERAGTCLIARICPRSRPYFLKLNRALYWRAINTLSMEIYLDIGLLCSLNVRQMQWLDNNPDLDFSNVLAIACFCFMVIYPVWLILFYCLKKP